MRYKISKNKKQKTPKKLILRVMNIIYLSYDYIAKPPRIFLGFLILFGLLLIIM